MKTILVVVLFFFASIFVYSQKTGNSKSASSSFKTSVTVKDNRQNKEVTEQDTFNLKEVTLFQNQPNPACCQTKIRFYLPEDFSISLTLFDINGNQVKEVVNGVVFSKEIISEIVIDVSNLPIGTYEYRLLAGGKVQSKKMMIYR